MLWCFDRIEGEFPLIAANGKRSPRQAAFGEAPPSGLHQSWVAWAVPAENVGTAGAPALTLYSDFPTRQCGRVTGCGASLEGDQVCAAMERAITQQPPDRGGVDIVGPRHIGLRLTRGEALYGFLPLMRCHLAGAAEPDIEPTSPNGRV
jgi:hypothetical protein